MESPGEQQRPLRTDGSRTAAADRDGTADRGGTAGAEAEVWAALRAVVDPELGIDIVALGLVYGVYVGQGGYAEVTLTTTTPGCPLQAVLDRQVRQALEGLPWSRRAVLNWVSTPAWTPQRISPDGLRRLGWR